MDGVMRIKTSSLTAERLRAILSYDPATGVLVWLVGNCRGKAAGSISGSGYIHVTINYVKYLAHRLAWLHATGVMPEGDLDHRNLNKVDNRFSNLRECNPSLNQANTTITIRNTSGRKGVSWCRKGAKWQAGIKYKGKQYHLGLFSDLVEAAAAYVSAAREHFGDFARDAA